MTIFIDASAMVAMLALEDDYESIADQLDTDNERITSGIAIWETTIALSMGQGIMFDLAAKDVANFLRERAVTTVAIGQQESVLALEAHRRFGKGRHKARLNMGDCFAYACAKANDARMLYKGNDFTHTDLA